MLRVSKLRDGVIYQALYQAIAVCIPLVTSPYLSRVLGSEGLGIYSYNYSIVSYFLIFATLGVATYGLRAISQSNSKREVCTNFWGIYLFHLIASVLSLIAYLLFILLCAKDRITYDISMIQVLYLLGECLNINWLFFGLEKNKSIVIRNLIIKIITVTSIFIFVNEQEDVTIYIFILALSYLLSNLVMWICLKGCITRVKIGLYDITKHIRPCLVLFIPEIAASVYHIMDKTFLGLFSDNANVGYYYNADKLLNIPLTVVTGCSAVFMSRACAQAKQLDICGLKKTQNESILFGMCMICAVAFGICAVTEEFIPLFFGTGYEECVILVKYFAAIVIIKTISTHTRSVFLIPENDDSSYAKSITIGALINLGVNYILIAKLRLGAIGATISTLFAEVLVVFLQIVFMKTREQKRECTIGVLKSLAYVLIGFLMFFAVSLIPWGDRGILTILILKIFVGAGMYILGCMIMWRFWPSLMPDMIKEMFQMLRKTFCKGNNYYV